MRSPKQQLLSDLAAGLFSAGDQVLLVLRALGLWAAQTLRGLIPRRRIWRFVQASRRPWVIGLELAALTVLWLLGAVQPGHLAAGGIAGAALALNFWDEM